MQRLHRLQRRLTAPEATRRNKLRLEKTEAYLSRVSFTPDRAEPSLRPRKYHDS
jgi:hypothetical protein